MIKFILLLLTILFGENYRIDCDAVCDTSSLLYSDFVCNTCNNNQRILNDCDTGTIKYFNSIDNDEEYVLRNGIDEYCANSSQLTEDLSDYFILNINSDLTSDDSLINYDLIQEYDCWLGDSGPGSCSSNTEPYFNAWGMLFKNHNPNNNISLHVNHPLHDINTLQISSYLFEFLNAKWMLFSGAHRYSLVDGNTPPDSCSDDPNYVINEVCNNSLDIDYNFGADPARAIDSCNGLGYTTPFQIFHEQISSNEFCTDLNEELISLSIQGFNNDNLRIKPAIIISNGNDSDNHCIHPDSVTSTIFHDLNNLLSITDEYTNYCSDNDKVAVIIEREIPCNQQPTSCGTIGSSDFTQYAAFSNPQGRYTNNTDIENINTDNDTWIHIEIDACIRNNFPLYVKTSEIIANAINRCADNQNCTVCDTNNPCSNNDLTYDLDCNCLNGIYLGDLNKDCDINVTDLVALVDEILDGNYSDRADYNQDNIVNIVDAVAIVNYILN